MIQINPLQSYIDGGARAAITSPPSASLVFDLPGKAIWVKGVKLKGIDHTYTFSHDNYITLTNTPGSDESEDILIGVNITLLKQAIDTTYTTGTLAQLTTGTDTTALVWTAKILAQYVAGVLPTTKKMKINGTDYSIYTTESSLPTFLAPTTLGTTGQILACTASGLTWVNQIQNTDYKVTQSSSSLNEDYRVILKLAANNDPETTFVRFSEYLTFNPSTKLLKINGLRVITFADIYVGATSTANATAGLVPAATSAQRTYFLRGDGTWQVPTNDNTWRPVKVEGTQKLASTTDTDALDFHGDTGIEITYDATNKKINIKNTAPDVNHNVTTTAIIGTSASATTQITAVQTNPYYNLLEGGAVTRSIQFTSNNITISSTTGGVISFIAKNWTGATSNAAGTAGYMPGAASTDRLKFLRGDGTWVALIASGSLNPSISDGSATNTVKITVGGEDSSNYTIPYATHSDTTNFFKAYVLESGTDINTVTDTKYYVQPGTSACAAMVNGPSGRTNGEMYLLNIRCGGNYGQLLYYSRGDNNWQWWTRTFSGTSFSNWVQIVHSGNISNKDATIGTSSTTIATIAGIDITAKIGSYAASSHTHPLSIAADSGTSSIALAASTKYKLTAGGSTYVFTSTPDENVKQTPKTDNVNRPLMMINGGTATGTLTSTSMFSTGIYANASTNMITANGFVKAGSDSSHVLLGDGSDKALSDLSNSHTHTWASITNKLTDGNAFDFANELTDLYFNWKLSGGGISTVPTERFRFTNGTGTETYALLIASGFAIYGSSNAYMLLAGGGLKALGDFTGTTYTAIPNGTGWYRIAETTKLSVYHTANNGIFTIQDFGSSQPCSRVIHASVTTHRVGLVQINGSQWGNTIQQARIIYLNSWNSSTPAYLEIYTTTGNASLRSYFSGYGWKIYDNAVAVSETLAENSVAKTLVLTNDGMAASTFSGNATSASIWQTARTLTIGNTGKSVNGSGNVSWSLAEIGALPAGNYASSDHTHDQYFLSRGKAAVTGEATVWSKLGVKSYENLTPDGLTTRKGYYWGLVLSFPSDSGMRFDLWMNCYSSSTSSSEQPYSDGLYYRTGWTSNKRSWLEILDQKNYTAYVNSTNFPILGYSASDFAAASHVHKELACRDVIAATGNANDFPNADAYFTLCLIKNGASNWPGAHTGDGELIWIPWSTSASYGTEIAVGADKTALLFRRHNGSAWENWNLLIHNNNISPSLSISGNTIAVSAGGVTSSYITVPFATNSTNSTYTNYLSGYYSSSFHPGDSNNAIYSSWTGSYYKLVTGGGYKTLVDYADSAPWSGITGRPSDAGNSTTPVYWASNAAVVCTSIPWNFISSKPTLAEEMQEKRTTTSSNGWLRIALVTQATNDYATRGCYAKIIITDVSTGNPICVVLQAGAEIGYVSLNQVFCTSYANLQVITKARIVYVNSWSSKTPAYLEVYINNGNSTRDYRIKSFGHGWTLLDPTIVSDTLTDGRTKSEIELHCDSIVSNNFYGSLTGNATSASKWQTARTFTIGNCSKSVDGSGNITWPLADIGVASHDHNLLLNYGNVAFSSMTSVPTNYLTYRIVSSGGNVLGDSLYEVLHLPWSNGDWGNYLIFGANNGRVGVKYQSSGEVRELLTNKNFTTFCNDTYVNVTGDTMTGSLTVSGGSITTNNYLYINAWPGYGSGSFSAWYNGSTSKLVCSTDISAPNFYTTSDRSKKQSISSFSEHIRKFQLKDTEKWHYGVIAQEVPEMFRDGEEGNMTVNYNSVLSFYIGQLENKVKMLEERIRILENK